MTAMNFAARAVDTTAASWFFVVPLAVLIFVALRLPGAGNLWITVGVVLVVAAAALLPGVGVRYVVRGGVLEARHLLFTRRVALRGARVRTTRLGRWQRLRGWEGLNGRHGLFRFEALPDLALDVHATDLRGTVVVLERPGRPPLVLSPADPDALVAALGGPEAA